MSHYATLVITDEQPTEDTLHRTLLPWHEYECTGYTEYTQFVDKTDEITKDWNTLTLDRYRDKDGTLRFKHDDFYRKPGEIGIGTGSHLDPVEVFGHEKVASTAKEIWPDVHDFAREWHGLGVNEHGRIGSVTNPSAKWDWWVVGGRYQGKLELNDGSEADVSPWKDVANRDKLTAFAIVKDGTWHERGEMGWFASVTNEKEKDAWIEELRTILATVRDDQWIAVVDCHI